MPARHSLYRLERLTRLAARKHRMIPRIERMVLEIHHLYVAALLARSQHSVLSLRCNAPQYEALSGRGEGSSPGQLQYWPVGTIDANDPPTQASISHALFLILLIYQLFSLGYAHMFNHRSPEPTRG
eukprot:4568479-Amphidinium_carterae.1